MRQAKGKPTLFFSLQLDSDSKRIAGLNQGRLSLWDDDGLINRWVATSSYEPLQGVNDWEKVGGTIPPNYAMPDYDWYQVQTALITQPDQKVKEGYLINYQNSNYWTTVKGTKRSEVMLHEDSNASSSPGTFGCIGLPPGDEWFDFKKHFAFCCGHLKEVRLGVIYNYQN